MTEGDYKAKWGGVVSYSDERKVFRRFRQELPSEEVPGGRWVPASNRRHTAGQGGKGRRTSKVAVQRTATLVSGNFLNCLTLQVAPRHTKRTKGRAQQHYSRSTIGRRDSTGAAKDIYVGKLPSERYLQGKGSTRPFILGNRVNENIVTVTILRNEPADHVSWVHGEVNLNLIMSGDRIEGQIGEGKGTERVGDRFVTRRLYDTHFGI
jgi:hypothetical protein